MIFTTTFNYKINLFVMFKAGYTFTYNCNANPNYENDLDLE